MKKLFVLCALVALLGCQKAELVEGSSDDGRNVSEEQVDSVSVTPEFEAEGWGEGTDVEFDFG